jgi:hypothetical protein
MSLATYNETRLLLINHTENFFIDGSVGLKFFSAKIKHRLKSFLKVPTINYFKKTIWWISLPLRFYYFFSNLGFIHKKKHQELFVTNDSLSKKQENYISIEKFLIIYLSMQKFF